mmetsp:Transcript_98913/g.235970  ORF Transcript_98913/g.235970 Transcript_98913/m.235970 type:complete len:205 (+) Transcript_98913:107-721(+)
MPSVIMPHIFGVQDMQVRTWPLSAQVQSHLRKKTHVPSRNILPVVWAGAFEFCSLHCAALPQPIRRFGAFFRRLQPPYVQHVIPLCFAKVEDFMHVRNAFRPISLLSGIFPNLLAVLLMRIHIWIGYGSPLGLSACLLILLLCRPRVCRIALAGQTVWGWIRRLCNICTGGFRILCGIGCTSRSISTCPEFFDGQVFWRLFAGI